MDKRTLELIEQICTLADKLPEELKYNFYKDKIAPILNIIMKDILADMNRGRR